MTSCEKVRYFAYIQVTPEEQNLWLEYAQLALSAAALAMKKVESAADIYPVFRELFEKAGGVVMTTRHLHNEARGYQPERGKGVPQQQSGHADGRARPSKLPKPEQSTALQHGDTPERPLRGKGKSV